MFFKKQKEKLVGTDSSSASVMVNSKIIKTPRGFQVKGLRSFHRTFRAAEKQLTGEKDDN